jgi:NTE family protein
LRAFLAAALPQRDRHLVGVERNIERGSLEAFAITTTSYATGRSITWVQGRGLELWERPERGAVATALTLDHIMASAALPLLFPAVRIGDEWHGDGGIRLTAPLSPAIRMGADRIIAVSPRYLRPDGGPTRSRLHGYPPPAHIAGLLMNAVFLDMLDADARNLRRINALIGALPARPPDLRPIDVLLLRPSRDLGRLASAHERGLPALFRFFMRGLGTGELRSADYLSLILFEPGYLERLIELGEEDAAERKREIHEFIEGGR